MTTFLGPRADVARHVRGLRARGADVRVVPAGRDKAGVLEAFAAALDLPEWFGRNWDALVDALRELEGTDGRRVELVWDRAGDLSHADPETYATVVDILEQVAEEREDLGVTVVAR